MSALFGYSHLTGGYPGGQAEYVRVPFSDVGPIVIENEDLDDDEVLFLSDILPTGWMAAENAEIGKGDVVAVWGAGPVGLFAAQSALVMGASRVIVIDHYPHRLELAKGLGAEVINFHETDVREALMAMSGGTGPDAVIDAVGMEAHGFAIDNMLDIAKQKVGFGADRASALKQAILAVRKGGRLSIPGVYGGMTDKFPLGALMEKGITVRSGQTHVQKYSHKLLDMIGNGKLDTTFLISHRLPLEDAADGYANFKNHQDDYTKVVLKPGMGELIMANKLAVITGASTGIGRELAAIAAEEGYDLVLVADEPQIDAAAGGLREHGVATEAVEADLATFEGNEALLAAVGDRPIDILVANAGRGLGHAFIDQDPSAWRRVIDTNVTGTTYLLQKVAQRMARRGEGRILITGSIAGLIPGSYQAVYNGTKAYLDSFAYALREELSETGVKVTVLMPGPTDTEFFRRADMLDTPVGKDDSKEDPAKTARNGWDAMMSGSAHVVSGAKNKIQAALSHLTPDSMLAKQHTKMAKPKA